LLVFALTLLAASFISGWLIAPFGAGGILVSSASVALVDVDVAVLTAGRLSQTAIDAGQAARAILLALAVNGLARICYSVFTGPRAYSARLALATLSAVAAGAVSLFAVA
jgi:uncharacterized membrane protein (DUF4010 family)